MTEEAIILQLEQAITLMLGHNHSETVTDAALLVRGVVRELSMHKYKFKRPTYDMVLVQLKEHPDCMICGEPFVAHDDIVGELKGQSYSIFHARCKTTP